MSVREFGRKSTAPTPLEVAASNVHARGKSKELALLPKRKSSLLKPPETRLALRSPSLKQASELWRWMKGDYTIKGDEFRWLQSYDDDEPPLLVLKHDGEQLFTMAQYAHQCLMCVFGTSWQECYGVGGRRRDVDGQVLAARGGEVALPR
jgi:hypothetical protein